MTELDEAKPGEGTPMCATVKDVMTARVIAVGQDAGYKEIVSVLRQNRVSACPVLDANDRVIGVVSEADLLFKEADPDLPGGLIRLQWRLADDSKANAVTAAQLMTAPAVTVHPGASMVNAARLMQDHGIKRLPVVGERGRLIGIISRADVLSVFERPDADIRNDVARTIIAGEFGLDPRSLEVTVTSGVVTITGTVDRRETALNLLARVRHAEGVVSVRDRLSYSSEGWSSETARPAAG
jgi:CBS domain-containing protein